MRDEIDARIWVENHQAFSDGIDRGLASLRAGLSRALASVRSGLSRFAGWDGTTHQLIAMVVAFAVTALTFNATTA